MMNPFDENWMDLAAELGVETPPPPPRVEEPPPQPPEEQAPTDVSLSIFEASALPDAVDNDAPDTEIIEAGGDTEADRKRRRRRRRRRKGESETPEAEAPETEEPSTQPSEQLRDILKNWDVPSWDEIVSGLYRPHR